MKKMLIVALLGAGVVCGQVSAETSGFKNGRFWDILTSTEKTCFLTGFMEGISSGFPSKVDEYASGLSFAETKKALDQFYEDPSNAQVPVMSAMLVVKSKVQGATPEELARRIAAVRKIWFDVEAAEKTFAEKATKEK